MMNENPTTANACQLTSDALAVAGLLSPGCPQSLGDLSADALPGLEPWDRRARALRALAEVRRVYGLDVLVVEGAPMGERLLYSAHPGSWELMRAALAAAEKSA